MSLRVAAVRWPDDGVPLSDGDALVYTSSLRASEAELHLALRTLSEAERERHASYANGVVARRYAIGRATTRAILGRHLSIDPAAVPLRQERYGKPVLARGVAPAALWFSVAHSDDLQLVALSAAGDVGVDVERSRAIAHWERVAERVLDPAERRQLARAIEAGQEAGPAFLRHWCRVEAELKAIGCGIQGLDAHREGARPAGHRVCDLTELPLPTELVAAGRRYHAAVALCTPRGESLRPSGSATAHATAPVARPATASTA
jgi:4'-phosphopantetheinyl transferase